MPLNTGPKSVWEYSQGFLPDWIISSNIAACHIAGAEMGRLEIKTNEKRLDSGYYPSMSWKQWSVYVKKTFVRLCISMRILLVLRTIGKCHNAFTVRNAKNAEAFLVFRSVNCLANSHTGKNEGSISQQRIRSS